MFFNISLYNNRWSRKHWFIAQL